MWRYNNMLGVFVKPAKDHKERQFKTAYLKLADGSQQAFRYYKLDTSEMQREHFISQIDFQSRHIIIRTTSTLEFNVKSKILIDGLQYTIEAFRIEDQDINNGPFISRNPVVFKYLYLVH